MRWLIRFIVLISLQLTGLVAQNVISVLDVTSKNAESTQGNLFSCEHILHTAGYSYSVTDSMNVAIKSKVVFITSNIESATFIQKERDSLRSFVKRGGVLIAVNIKDSLLYDIFGVSTTLFNYNRFYINFRARADTTIFKLFDDPNEQQIRLGDPAQYITTIGTRAFKLSTADTLATYETNEVAAAHNSYYAGHTYLLGTQLKEVVFRPQVKQDYAATRAYSNNFEPGSDVYTFFVAGVLKKHLQYGVYKHSSPCNFKSALVITHDVDATTSSNLYVTYGAYEKSNNFHSTYLITTHYVHDKLAKDFFDGFEGHIETVSQMGHDIQSHSVSHVPDFDIETTVAVGSPGNNRNTYLPYFDGTTSSHVTVFGEAEVSRDLIQSVINKPVTLFRSGYLCFHKNLVNVLDSLHFKFNSSHSANDVMTNFPYFEHTDLSMNGRLTKLLEIPNTISDVFSSERMSEDNFLEKVEIWKSAFFKAYNNNAATVLLIHPTRFYKLYAEQLLISALPQNAVISNLEEYGNYWLNRNDVDISTVINVDTISIYLSRPANNINDMLSFVINNGKYFKKIKVFSSDMVPLVYTVSSWENNSVILHKNCARPSYTDHPISENPEIQEVGIFPNPSDNIGGAKLHFKIMIESTINVSVYDMKGALVAQPVIGDDLNIGAYDVTLPANSLAEGTYSVRLTIGENRFVFKWIVMRSR